MKTETSGDHRAVGDLLKFVKGDGEQKGNYHFISVNQMPALLC